MRCVTLRRNMLLAACTSMLLGAAVAEEPSAHTATVSYPVPSDVSRGAGWTDIRALTVDAGVSDLMRKDTPDDVHRAALRQLWASMAPPVSCYELCLDAEAVSSGLPGLTSETSPIDMP